MAPLFQCHFICSVLDEFQFVKVEAVIDMPKDGVFFYRRRTAQRGEETTVLNSYLSSTSVDFPYLASVSIFDYGYWRQTEYPVV